LSTRETGVVARVEGLLLTVLVPPGLKDGAFGLKLGAAFSGVVTGMNGFA